MPVGDPIAYGDVFSRTVSGSIINLYGLHRAAPGGVDPIVSSFGGAGSGDYVTKMPIGVGDPAGTCPSCLWFGF
jgi:hypothetical protein